MKLFALLASFALLVAAPAAAQSLTPVERRIAAAAAAPAEHARSVALLERLVNTNSGTLNLPGVEQVGRMMRAELEPLGFQVRWIPQSQVQRAGHLVATKKGSGRGRRMLLIGHLDTVFEPDSPFQQWTRRGDLVEGPGVNDMKGGMVVMLQALRALHATGALKDADVTVVLTGDEERVGRPHSISRADLITAGRANDVALEFESLARREGRDHGSVARRSSSGWSLRVAGKQGHSSGIFTEGAGAGAAYELARIIDAFRRELPEPSLTFNVGLMAAGTTAELDPTGTALTASGKTNVIPPVALAQGDIRTLSEDQTARVRAKMQAIVARSLPRTSAEITFTDGYPAMAPSTGSRALLAELNGVNRDLGLPEMPELDPALRGAGDIAFVGWMPGLIGLGIYGQGAHAPGEAADLSSIDRQAQRAALLMYRLSRTKGPRR
ncbi:MAG TPA: M20/M25/M40 family metallo-hydrolase [Caulobacteraceae bacterium]|jgi:glutamate carboxypeptidase